VHRAGHLADRAFTLGVAGMADQHDFATGGGIAPALVVHLGNQRAGGVDYRQTALAGQFFHTLRDTVGAEDGHGARGNLVEFVDEHRAALAQILNHVPVVHDFVPHINRRAVLLQRPLDDLDRPFDAGTKSARLRQHDA